jgi:hypothetical protein
MIRPWKLRLSNSLLPIGVRSVATSLMMTSLMMTSLIATSLIAASLIAASLSVALSSVAGRNALAEEPSAAPTTTPKSENPKSENPKSATTIASPSAGPRLVVIVSVDQLCYEYLERFRAGFRAEDFFRQVEERGAWFSQAHHRHAFTVTAPGHAVLMTGAYPHRNGILGNDWFNRKTGKMGYCVEDIAFPIVGTPAGAAELKGVSPKSLTAETLGDVLKRVTDGKAKVFGVTLKDRAAVLMTGAKADGAYWFDSKSGCWVTSRYYRESLPVYVRELNEARVAERYAGRAWELSRDAAGYRLNYPDDSPFEGDYEKLGRGFPHTLAADDPVRLRKQIATTPFGNELALELAERVLREEQLGQDDVCDLLAVGFSSNDYVGHTFGPHSLEVEDMTYRTDAQLARLVRMLDEHVGAGQWTLALSADHAVAPIPEYAASIGLPAKRNPLGDPVKLRARLEERLADKFGPPTNDKTYVESMDGTQLFLRASELGQRGPEIRREVQAFLREQPALAVVLTRDELLDPNSAAVELPEKLRQLVPPGSTIRDQFLKAFHPQLSGDLLFAFVPYSWQGTTKATHGSPWTYDTHVPVLWLGRGVKRVRVDRPVSPAAIGVTFARLLGVPAPAQNEEQPLVELLGEAR